MLPAPNAGGARRNSSRNTKKGSRSRSHYKFLQMLRFGTALRMNHVFRRLITPLTSPAPSSPSTRAVAESLQMDPKKNQRDLPHTPGHFFRPLELPRSYSPVGSRCQT